MHSNRAFCHFITSPSSFIVSNSRWISLLETTKFSRFFSLMSRKGSARDRPLDGTPDKRLVDRLFPSSVEESRLFPPVVGEDKNNPTGATCYWHDYKDVAAKLRKCRKQRQKSRYHAWLVGLWPQGRILILTFSLLIDKSPPVEVGTWD